MSTRSLSRTGWRRATFDELQSSAASGEQWAADALADEFLPRLVSFAKVRGATDPDGIAHVSLLAVLQRLATDSQNGSLHFGAKEQMWAYLCQTARSRMIDEFRAAKPVILIDANNGLEEAVEPDFPSMRFEDLVAERDYVDRLLSPLTAEQRQVLEMRFFHDLSIEETASLTGRSQDAVKGMQRRAIRAIIAAAALILVFVVLRQLSDEQEARRTINAPANTGVVTDDVDPLPADDLGIATPDGAGDSASDTSSTDDEGATVVVRGDAQDADPERVTEPAIDATEAASAEDQTNLTRFEVTLGSERSTEIDTSGVPVSESVHGVRVYCVVSHFAYGDPAGSIGGPATMYWGNTGADASSAGQDLSATGNGSCEGGISDRSAYWMSGFFDNEGQVVLPEKVAVEYKSFGHPSFDRSTVQPIPAGLEVMTSSIRSGPTGQDGSRTTVVASFPECVMTDEAGMPVLSSRAGSTHLAEADASNVSGCPGSHPYRVPQVTYIIEYDVPYESGWSLSTGHRVDSPAKQLAAGFIAGMDKSSAERVAKCVVELLDHCEFVGFADGKRLSRSQLPERFVNPDDMTIYIGSATLVGQADRTPFDDSVSPFS